MKFKKNYVFTICWAKGGSLMLFDRLPCNPLKNSVHTLPNFSGQNRGFGIFWIKKNREAMTIPIHYPSLILGCNPGADFFGGWEKHVMKGTNVGMFFLWEKQRLSKTLWFLYALHTHGHYRCLHTYLEEVCKVKRIQVILMMQISGMKGSGVWNAIF